MTTYRRCEGCGNETTHDQHGICLFCSPLFHQHTPVVFVFASSECLHCGTDIPATHPFKKYCTDTCRKRAARDRERTGARA